MDLLHRPATVGEAASSTDRVSTRRRVMAGSDVVEVTRLKLHPHGPA
jgi:hypothetical protein